MKLACWHCGGSLKDVPRPIRSQMRCPQCRADLHVCRMCRHYDTRYIGHCSHDEADRVTDKESANYCTFFAPSPNAFVSTAADPAERARAELDALFGADQAAADAGAAGEAAGDSQQRRALREAESLFTLGTKKGPDEG